MISLLRQTASGTFVEVSLGDRLLADVGDLLDVVHTAADDVGSADDAQCVLEVVAGRLPPARLHPDVQHHQRPFHVRVEVGPDLDHVRRRHAQLCRQRDPVRLDRLGDVRQTQLSLRNVLLCTTAALTVDRKSTESLTRGLSPSTGFGWVGNCNCLWVGLKNRLPKTKLHKSTKIQLL